MGRLTLGNKDWAGGRVEALASGDVSTAGGEGRTAVAGCVTYGWLRWEAEEGRRVTMEWEPLFLGLALRRKPRIESQRMPPYGRTGAFGRTEAVGSLHQLPSKPGTQDERQAGLPDVSRSLATPSRSLASGQEAQDQAPAARPPRKQSAGSIPPLSQLAG